MDKAIIKRLERLNFLSSHFSYILEIKEALEKKNGASNEEFDEESCSAASLDVGRKRESLGASGNRRRSKTRLHLVARVLGRRCLPVHLYFCLHLGSFWAEGHFC